jgi:hypothetical protein
LNDSPCTFGQHDWRFRNVGLRLVMRIVNRYLPEVRFVRPLKRQDLADLPPHECAAFHTLHTQSAAGRDDGRDRRWGNLGSFEPDKHFSTASVTNARPTARFQNPF